MVVFCVGSCIIHQMELHIHSCLLNFSLVKLFFAIHAMSAFLLTLILVVFFVFFWVVREIAATNGGYICSFVLVSMHFSSRLNISSFAEQAP